MLLVVACCCLDISGAGRSNMWLTFICHHCTRPLNTSLEGVRHIHPKESTAGALCESTLAHRMRAERAGQSFPTLWCGPLSWV